MESNILRLEETFVTEGGRELKNPEIAYTVYGTLNGRGDNAILIFHALTANSEAHIWWADLVGPGKMLDPAKYFIVCPNVLGSCYGSSGPLSTNPDTGLPYYSSFPLFTIKDNMLIFDRLRRHLGIHKIHTCIGGSLGGQQALEWAVTFPELTERLIVIAANAVHSAWGIAFNESQRMAIKADPTWQFNLPNAGQAGLKAARSIALLSYRNYDTYRLTQCDESREAYTHYKAITYQQYQGEKIVKRFNAHSYLLLSEMLDAHNVGRGRGGVEKALARVTAHTLTIGVTSDLLFPPVEQQYIARCIPGARYAEIDSIYGHDGFLIENSKLETIIREFYSY